MDIIIKPLNTEKAARFQEVKRKAYNITRGENGKIVEKKPIERVNNRYLFVVAKDANKIEIKNAIEEIYDVKVVNVNTVITNRKIKQRFTKRGQISGTKQSVKKAYVTLAEGNQIDIFNN